jgi:uroporphyrinogen-III synthase
MRVLVTRPLAQGEATAARLRKLGHEALVAPLLTIRRTGDPPPETSFDALVVTSSNAVGALAAFDRTLPVFAVGERTASLVREAGFDAVLAGKNDGEALAGLVGSTLSPRTHLLHVAGRDRKSEPGASLTQAGFAVDTFVAYEAVPVETLPIDLERALAERALDAALHYSRRSAETALALVRRAGCERALLALAHVCLSRDAAAPLLEQGAGRLIVAEEPREASLFQALALCESLG